jgi:hypothetical protein
MFIPSLVDAMFEAGVGPHTAGLLQRNSPSMAEQQRKSLLCRVPDTEVSVQCGELVLGDLNIFEEVSVPP